jgi:diguanylate cyclase (GGDEF)-like protein/PAS domain S-box-containing protein
MRLLVRHANWRSEKKPTSGVWQPFAGYLSPTRRSVIPLYFSHSDCEVTPCKYSVMHNQTTWKQRDLDAADTAIAVLDQDANIALINQHCCALLGDAHSRLTGKNWFDLLAVDGRRDEAKQIFHRVMSGEEGLAAQFERPIETRRADGSTISWCFTALRDADGRIDGALCLGKNVTDYKLAELRLLHNSEEQNALNAILRLSLENIPIKEQFERVLDILLALSWLQMEPKGGIFQVDKTDSALTLISQRGLAPAQLSACARVPFGHCLCGRAATSREVQYVSSHQQAADASHADIGPHGHYHVPIISNGNVLGVMVLYLKQGHVQQERETEFLVSVASTLAGMINHRLIQNELLESRARLERTQRFAHLGGWEWNLGSRQFTLSEESCRILNTPFSANTMSLGEALNFFHPDDRPVFSKTITQAVTEGDTLDHDYRIRLQNGAERVVNCQAEPSYDAAGNVVRLTGTLHDITERKYVEDKLRLSATVFENTSEGVMIADSSGHIISVNRAVTTITGYSADELIGKTPAILKSGRQDQQFYASLWQSIRETGHWQGELWNRRKNGDIYPEWLNISVARNEHGEVTNHVAIFSDISAMKESESKLKHLAHHDPLTGLPNRMLLNARMHQSMAYARRNNTILAILFLDLDKFKMINDTLGHPVGDLLLQEVARRLTDCLREEDTISRLGGDEFVVLLENLGDTCLASSIAQKINAALAKKFQLLQHEIFISCSIGISIFPNDGDDIDVLFKNADSALYRAKELGRDNYQYYTADMSTRAMERMLLENDLRHALERNELLIYYQPQADLYNGSIIGMEALLRWQHPQNGLMLPASFIPLAEETGLINPIGEWVLRTACARLKTWMDAGMCKSRVSVNLSSIQFKQKNLVEVVAAALHDSGLPPECLELELTESMIMHDAESTILLLQQIKALGVRIAIDDFGTGYSSLSHLKRFPIDRIKIDQSFVRNITTDPADAAVSQAIISMSHSLNMTTVAEGVETEAQLEFLRSRHCNEIQGFHFSHPLPEREMERLMQTGYHIQSTPTAAAVDERIVLLIDDDEFMLAALAESLHPDGYRILCTTRASEALDFLATHRVGVIISDQNMPEMNGIELLRKARQLHPGTVRIMLTAQDDQQLTSAAINEGAVYKFIIKPWDIDKLRTDVRAAFRHHGLISQSANIS